MSQSIGQGPSGPRFTDDVFNALGWLGDAIPGGFFIYRPEADQPLIYVNRATLDIFGCETMDQFRALTGDTFPGLIYPPDREATLSAIESQIANAANGHMDHVEYRIRRRDGEIRWVDDYGRFSHMPGHGDVYYVFITDVTDKRRAREEKIRMEVALDREKHVNELKNRFLFNLSHDIRTPMNAVMGFTELARRHMDDPALLADCLDRSLESSRQMLALIDDMLEMSRLESGHIHLRLENCDLIHQIDRTLDLFRLPAAEKQISLYREIDLPGDAVMADATRLRRVLSNLLDNAVKFTPPGGAITLRARRRGASDSGFSRYEFQVADTGPGIAEASQERIFESFEREASATLSGVQGGAGMGLAIVRSLVRLMGGSVSVQSAKGQGACFTVALPLRLAEHPAVVPAESTPAGKLPGRQRRILVVEDIEINRDIAEMLLTEAGFIVETVEDGCDAVEAVQNRPAGYYDLVLMDIQMPVMNGYEATRAIRALPRPDAARLPILALSANAREEDRRMSLESGMNAHIAKPFDIDALITAINGYIESGG